MELIEFTKRFDTPEKCLAHIKNQRWRKGSYCPHCGSSEKIYEYSDGIRYKCSECKRVFRIITGTIFGDTQIKKLPQWFLAIYFETTHSKGIASAQLAKHLDIRQPTAWFMLQRIRNALTQITDESSLLSGTVEVDETYLGGKESNKPLSKRQKGTQGRSTKTKQPVFGIKERTGLVKAFSISKVNRKTIIPITLKNVELGTTVNADEFTTYNSLSSFYPLKRVNHSVNEYVNGLAHTNGIESFWATLKRVYMGTHHWWSNKHTQRYLNAVCFRENNKHNRKEKMDIVNSMFLLGLETRITYKELIQ